MAELGVPRFIVERVLNDTDRTVTSVDDRSSYSTEKMAAVRELDALVDRMVTRHRTQARHDASSRRDLSDRRLRREVAPRGRQSGYVERGSSQSVSVGFIRLRPSRTRR